MKLCKSILLLIPVSLTLICCKDNSPHHYISLDSKPGLPASDTARPVITTNYKGKEYPAFFEAAFEKSTTSKQDDFVLNFSTIDLGNINIESGKIIACDPVVLRTYSSLVFKFPIGSFPVQLSLAKVEHDRRVAFSRIVFSSNPVENWELALYPGQKPTPVGSDSIYCYGVDAGEGLFIDSVASVFLNQKDESYQTNALFNRDLVTEDGPQGYIHQFDNHNLAIFNTGMGDGCYATYIGFDSAGKPCRLLTDFGLVEWQKLR